MEEKKKEDDNIYIYSEEDDKVNAPSSKDIGGIYPGETGGIDEYVYSDDAEVKENIDGTGNSEEADLDNSATNFAHYSDEDIEKAKNGGNAGEENGTRGGVSIFGLLLKTMFNPVEGWKAIRRNKITPEEAQKECFYPLLSVYSISKFAILAYSAKADLSEVVVDAVTSFVSFFFGYFLIVMTLRHILTKSVAEVFDTNFGKTLVVISLSSLCLFFILTELLPMLWAILIFLPLWTVYMICRATKFFKIPEDRQLLTIGLLNLIIIGMPAVLEWAFSEILPK